MTAFLIIVAVLVVIIAAILSVSATFTVIYDNKWKTTISVLWFEKDIELTKILSFVLFPQESARKVKDKSAQKKQETSSKEKSAVNSAQPTAQKNDATVNTENSQKENNGSNSQPVNNAQSENKGTQVKPAQAQKKPNYFKNIWDKDGIVGIFDFISNVTESASSAVTTLIKGFHIYSLYVKIIVGGRDADEIARSYGRVCKYYYPFKGAVLGGMKVDNYDDMVMPDFIAPKNEYGLQFIGSVSVAVLLRVALSAGKTFLVNLLKK